MEWQRSVAAANARGAESLTPSDAATFLAAAVNCSSAGRATPLHAAAEEGDASRVQALLRLGAVVDARDRSGATPLFLACEAGRDRSVEALLGANAAINVRNAADETVSWAAPACGLGKGPPCQPRRQNWAVVPDTHLNTGNMAAAVVLCLPTGCHHPRLAPCSRCTSQPSRDTSAAWSFSSSTARPPASPGSRSACTGTTAGAAGGLAGQGRHGGGGTWHGKERVAPTPCPACGTERSCPFSCPFVGRR